MQKQLHAPNALRRHEGIHRPLQLLAGTPSIQRQREVADCPESNPQPPPGETKPLSLWQGAAENERAARRAGAGLDPGSSPSSGEDETDGRPRCRPPLRSGPPLRRLGRVRDRPGSRGAGGRRELRVAGPAVGGLPERGPHHIGERNDERRSDGDPEQNRTHWSARRRRRLGDVVCRGFTDVDVEVCRVRSQGPISVPLASEQVETIPLNRSQILGRELELGGDVGELEPPSQALLPECLPELGKISRGGPRPQWTPAPP